MSFPLVLNFRGVFKILLILGVLPECSLWGTLGCQGFLDVQKKTVEISCHSPRWMDGSLR